PSAEEPPLRSYTINLADDAHSRNAAPTGPLQPTPLEAPAPLGSGAAQAAAVESTPPAPVLPPQSVPARAAAPSSVALSAANGVAAGSWMVQLGSFASRANAERLARQVRAGGFKVSLSQARSGRRLFRVRVGPAHDREAVALAAWVIALFLAWHFADLIAPHLGGLMSDSGVRPWAARVIIVLLVLLLGAGVGAALRHFVRLSIFSGMDRLLGFAFGLLRGLVLLGVFVILGQLLRLPEERWWQHSMLIPYGESIANGLRMLVGEERVRRAAGELRVRF